MGGNELRGDESHDLNPRFEVDLLRPTFQSRGVQEGARTSGISPSLAMAFWPVLSSRFLVFSLVLPSSF